MPDNPNSDNSSSKNSNFKKMFMLPYLKQKYKFK